MQKETNNTTTKGGEKGPQHLPKSGCVLVLLQSAKKLVQSKAGKRTRKAHKSVPSHRAITMQTRDVTAVDGLLAHGAAHPVQHASCFVPNTKLLRGRTNVFFAVAAIALAAFELDQVKHKRTRTCGIQC